jgi:hypothetical protein
MPRLEFNRKTRAAIIKRAAGKCEAAFDYHRPEYRTWINMKSRCYNPNTPQFYRYGGRGIGVCEQWRSSFKDFFCDVGSRPTPEHSLDRWPNQNGNYEPGNVRWATSIEQSRNLTNNRIVQVGGRSMTLAQAVEAAPVPYNTVLYRLRRGWSVDDALSRPAQKGIRP